MAATRLSDSQKTELVARFREGSSSQDLAEAFGCSPNTVTRVVRSALGDEAYERIKRQRNRRRRLPAPGEAPSLDALQAALPIAEPEPAVLEPEEPPFVAAAAADPDPVVDPEPDLPPALGFAREVRRLPDPPRRRSAAAAPREEEGEDGPAVLAIEDADDFGADDDDDLLADDELLADEDGDGHPFQPIPVVLLEEGGGSGAEARLQTLAAASLPASAYMLVDKTVELQARPLSEFPELGRLPAEELERQALAVFLNPRQAKRQCGRSQRVIKVPDLKVFERTAPYLLAQGISRVVIEGALYALPGS
jgi:hypothetical protein